MQLVLSTTNTEYWGLSSVVDYHFYYGPSFTEFSFLPAMWS